MKTLVIADDQLSSTDDAYADTTFNGRLFDGIGYERTEHGLLRSLAGYRAGKLHGPLRSWYPTGQIHSEVYHHGGGLHGPYREWYENGQPKCDAYFEYGYCVRRKSWDPDGTPLESQSSVPSEQDLDAIAKRRKQFAAPVIDIEPGSWDLVQKPVGWGQDAAELATVERLHQAWRYGPP